MKFNLKGKFIVIDLGVYADENFCRAYKIKIKSNDNTLVKYIDEDIKVRMKKLISILGILFLHISLSGCLNGITGELPDVATADHINGKIHDEGFEPICIAVNDSGNIPVFYTDNMSEMLYFDYNNDGFRESTAWPTEMTGVFVIDENKNAVIDNSTEILGNDLRTEQGTDILNLLKKYDSNFDNKLSADDEIFDKLFIWDDIDKNAFFDENDRLISMPDAEIAYISVDIKPEKTVLNDHSESVGTAVIHKQNKEKSYLSVMLLKTEKMFTVAADFLPETEEIKSLPDFKGYGRTYDLHQAMLRDDSLKECVKAFVAEKDKAKRIELLNNIIFKLTGVENSNTDYGEFVEDGRKTDALKVFFNEDTTNLTENTVLSEEQARIYAESYEDIFNYMYNDLIWQIYFADISEPLYDADCDIAKTVEPIKAKMEELDEPDFYKFILTVLEERNKELPENKQIDIETIRLSFEE